jgi:arylsulfatase A-like enzyme
MLGWTRLPERVTLVPALILAAGVTAQAIRSARPRLERFAAYALRSAPRGALLLAVPVLVVFSGRMLPDWRSDVEPAAGSPNVLLIVLDTKRARSMGLYGYDGQTTPRLDEIAARGVTFDAAYSPAAWTLPAHAAMFTGQYPVDIDMMGQQPLAPRHATVAEAFETAGYATGGFAGNLFFLSEIFRLNRGFREWRTVPLDVESLAASMWAWRSGRQTVRDWLGAHRYLVLKDAANVNGETLEWLDGLPEDRPFFAFLNYFDAHEPYTAAPEPDLDGRNDQRTEFLPEGDDAAKYTPERIDELREAYDRSIQYLDARVGELFDGLEARGRLENTIVVITSDHGEQFGDHGLMDHGNSLYRDLVHVPLIVLLPDGKQAGRRIEVPVGTHQIAATLEDLAGLGRTLPGASLRPALEDAATREKAPVFSFLRFDAIAVSSGDHRYIVRESGREELYDVAADPFELNDLSGDPEYAAVVDRLRLLVQGRDAVSP